MINPKKPVKSFKHKEAKRAHIPSQEEAGYEEGSPKVREAGKIDLPLNPIISRGQDPELFWMNKYGTDEKLTKQVNDLQARLKAGDNAGARTALENLRDTITRRYEQPEDESLSVDIRSLYRHEHVAPETLIKGLYRIVTEKAADQDELFAVNELFGNAIAHEELDKVSDYYTHSDGWTNRLIQGDSLLVMTSLLQREGMAGQVQCIYIDPPYGIKYGGNWQLKLNDRHMGGTDLDESLSGEPEQIKAFRDTWELGIHSYLGYLRERLLVARELLHESGSCFVQISDENVHLVRSLMSEVFGSEAHVVTIPVKKKGSQKSNTLAPVNDYVVWFARTPKENGQFTRLKVRKLFERRELDGETLDEFRWVELPDGRTFPISSVESEPGKTVDYRLSPRRLFENHQGAKLFRPWPITNGGFRPNQMDSIEFEGKVFTPPKGRCWSYRSNKDPKDPSAQIPMHRLREARRLCASGNSLDGKRYLDDFPYKMLTNWWDGLGGTADLYVVETNTEILKRCLLMTSDPGDLVLDPTCGSGTTAYVAEHWGRRWITIDTSRIAVNIAKTRLMTATFPYYQLYDQEHGDVRQGFNYKRVPHIDLGTIANNETPREETLYDQPLEDKKRLRVAGPFTVETLQSYEPISPEELARQRTDDKDLGDFEELIFAHLKSAGVKTGRKEENAVFVRINRLANSDLHAEGWYCTDAGEKKAYLHIGPKFGTVSKQAVTEAIKAVRDRRDGDWLLIMGFAFESGLVDVTTRDFGHFKVSLVRMHDDLMQQGLLKKDKKAASFVTIGEPDIRIEECKVGKAELQKGEKMVRVEIAGLDIYDPIKDVVKSRDVHDIAYWMVDDDYDGSNFVVRQVFFCGGDKDEFEEWKKGLSDLARAKTKKAAEQTLKIEIDDEAFERVYGHMSHPFPLRKGQRVAVRVISQFGEETTKVMEVK